MSSSELVHWSTAATAARIGPETAAVTTGLELCWSDVAERAARWRSWLKAAGARRNVAVVAERSVETMTLVMALVESGRRAVLLHPRWTSSEIREAVERVPEHFVVDSSVAAWHEVRCCARAAQATGAALGSVVVFTSGTTGASQGVELSGAVLGASAEASARHLGWDENDRWLCCLPLAHVGGLSIVMRCWLGGRAVVLEPEGRFDPERAATSIERQRVTMLSLVPMQLKALLDIDGWVPPRRLRTVLVGGAAATDDLLERASERGVPVRPTYGLTETASQVVTWPAAIPWSRGNGIGPPLPGVELELRGDDRIAVRGAMVAPRSFPDGAALTDAAGWLLTGDRGRLDEHGWLHVIGRADDVIVTGGENVDPRAVEAALEQCAGVESACVVGLPDATWGEIVGAVVTVSGPGVLDALQLQLDVILAPHARPRRIVPVETIPCTVTGKPDRRAVARLLDAAG